MTSFEFRNDTDISKKTGMFGLYGGEEIMTLAFFVLIQYRSVTDGRSPDGQTDIPPLAIPALAWLAMLTRW